MSLWVIPIVSIGGLIFGGAISIFFILPFTSEWAYKSYERQHKKKRDKATKGMTDLEKSLWDVFN